MEEKSRRVGELEGGGVKSTGIATIRVLNPDIGVVCDIPFHITENESYRTVLRLRDLPRTDLDNIVQIDWVHCLGRIQKLVRENDFFFYRWSSDTALF